MDGAIDRVINTVLRRRRIRALRRHEIHDLAADIAYYKPREAYMTVASTVAADLIDRRRLRTALEVGPHLRPVIVGADTMELEPSDALSATSHLLVHDATSTPWPVEDKAYDLFVALQVFEHFHGHQPEAFREVRRVARHAILSLPIDWVMADPANCHHQLSNDRVLSWFAPVTPTRIVLGNGGQKKRLLYVFEDLRAPDGAVGDGVGAEGAPGTTQPDVRESGASVR